MKISIDVPLERMGDPQIRQLVVQLVDLLSGTGSPAPRRGRPPGRKNSPKVAPTKKSPTFTPNEADGNALLEALPGDSKIIMTALREKGTLTMRAAQKLIKNSNPKAVGGIVGSVARWAPKNGFEVPYTTGKNERNERFWRWYGTAKLKAAGGAKKRGRPRKSEAAKAEPKRGPGRPKKSETAVAKPKRGRPKKTKTAASRGRTKKATGKKRGRPKKTRATSQK